MSLMLVPFVPGMRVGLGTPELSVASPLTVCGTNQLRKET